MAVTQLREGLERVHIYFEQDTIASAGTETTLDGIANQIKRILEPISSEFTGRIELQGLSDSTGDRGQNDRLRLRRADWVRDQLLERGINGDYLFATASAADGEADVAWRRVEFTVRDAHD